MYNLFVFVIFLPQLIPLASGRFISGLADINLFRIDDCPGSENLEVKFPIYIHKINRTKQVLDFNMTLPFDIDKNVGIDISAAIWGDGGWKKNAFSMRENKICESLNLFLGQMWFELEEKSGITPKKCPIKKGFYSGNNIELDINKMRVKTFMYGKFRSEVKVIKEKKMVLCKHFELELGDKKRD